MPTKEQTQDEIESLSELALVIEKKTAGEFSLIEIISDQIEISYFQSVLLSGEGNPLSSLASFRKNRVEEEESFSDYVETLVSKPFVNDDVRTQALRWFHSKIRIEKFLKWEREAAQVVANYAFELVKSKPSLENFYVTGRKAAVHIQIFKI